MSPNQILLLKRQIILSDTKSYENDKKGLSYNKVPEFRVRCISVHSCTGPWVMVWVGHHRAEGQEVGLGLMGHWTAFSKTANQ